VTERERRRAAREARGRERAKSSRQPTRRELEDGAHLLHCDRKHGRRERCNRNKLPKPEAASAAGAS
jgi:hypothetical protein